MIDGKLEMPARCAAFGRCAGVGGVSGVHGDYEALRREARAMEAQLRQWRRDFHTYAEPGWCEVRTASRVAGELTRLGYEVLTGRDVCLAEARMGLPPAEVLEAAYGRALEQGADPQFAAAARGGFTGVIGVLRCGPGPVTALRFDMDALGVRESEAPDHRPAAEGFRSVNEGVMHACGHDGHTAMGLAAARLLMRRRDRLRGTVKLIFQPAEEGVRGAAAIVAAGHLDDADYVLATHMGDRGTGNGQVGLTTGTTLATAKLDIAFTGRAVHAAMAPEQGANALLAAAAAVLALHGLPRHSGGDTRVNVGTLRAGTGRNVVCDRAVLEAEVRGATTAVCDDLEQAARRIVQGAAEMEGCTCDVVRAGAAGALFSDAPLLALCRETAEAMGLCVPPTGTTDSASEDFAAMADRVRSRGGQALYFRTLTACSGPFHSAAFDFDESALPDGAALLAALALRLSHSLAAE